MKRTLMQPEEPSLFSVAQRRWTVAGRAQERGADVGAGSSVDQTLPAAAAGLELFQATPAADGYERWKAETAQARAEAAAARRAGELPANTDGGGYQAWKSEAEAARRAFEQRWGVPLGKRVRVRLQGDALEHEGRLSVVEERSHGRELRLRLGTTVFAAGRIESVVRLDD